MDGFVSSRPGRRLDVLVAEPWPGLPRVGRLAREEIAHRYAIAPAAWRDRVAVVHVTLSGGAWVELDGRRATLRPGQMVLFNSREHRIRLGSDPDLHPVWETCWADLAGEPARAAVRALVRRWGPVVPGGTGVAAAIGRHLPDRGVRQVAWSASEAAQVAWEILAALAGEAGAPPARGLVAIAAAWFDAHLAAPAGVAAAARALGLSRQHFTRRFAALAGCSPGDWLRRRRIERAGQLIAAGVPIADAAARVGFASRSHFAIAFRRMRGRNPGDG